MGKYDSRIDIVDASMLDIVAKKWIANELAEMNRLKRLELSLHWDRSFIFSDGSYNTERILKELEDKANLEKELEEYKSKFGELR